MPIYEYRCEVCGHLHEVLQRMSDSPLTMCPKCGEEGLRKQLTAPGFQLKGSGWYETDFKGKDKKPDKEKSDAKESGEKKSTSKEASSYTKASSGTSIEASVN